MILWLKALVSLLERWTVSASWDFFLNFLFHTHDLTLFCGILFANFDIYVGFPWDCTLWILEWHLLKIRTNKSKSIVKQSNGNREMNNNNREIDMHILLSQVMFNKNLLCTFTVYNWYFSGYCSDVIFS